MNTPNRKYNFSAGPCTLPLEVLEQAQAEFVDYQGAGMSLIEMSHRGAHVTAVAEQARANAMRLFQVSDDFSVLFLQGGATLQFSMIPMNLLHGGQKGAYVHSGVWAKGAIADGQQYGEVYTAWDGADNQYTRMPSSDEIRLQDNTRYLHITTNETIGGVRFADWPQVEVPLIGDMSSEYMARPIPWEKFDLVYGGVQKNLGPAGLALVFVRKSILQHSNQKIGSYLRYDMQASKESMLNTPPVFSIYLLGKVLEWMQRQGGLAAMESRAADKAGLLYTVIDDSDGYYQCPVDVACRSHMNVVFRLPDEQLERKFLADSDALGLVNLKGHRSVGGCRASIYNAMPIEGVQVLADFMRTFKNHNG